MPSESIERARMREEWKGRKADKGVGKVAGGTMGRGRLVESEEDSGKEMATFSFRRHKAHVSFTRNNG